jgi:hypothetical protein
MRRINLILSLLCGLTLIANPLSGQHFLKANGKAIVNENQDTILLRGMGLGGWMVQEGYMLQTAGFANPQHEIRATIEDLIGPANTDVFYDAWLDNHVRKTDVDSLKAWGFNSVRLPMHYNLFTLPIEDEPVAGQQTWLTRGFELTDSVISWCKQNQMYVILDLHAAPGGQGYDAGISDYDDTKPSLWESKANRDKMVALWKRLAERYVDEPWVAGYDLLNEPNWDLPGNVAMRELYEEVTDSIRSVDSLHMIIIEGNWFANDFTGLTPPWDDNLVYSPHKYWSNNDEATMQWVIDLRNTHNVPLYLGESGENSNVWFRDAIHLLEGLDIGWAWWPMKKVEAIAGPLSVIKTDEYQALLDYWSGNGPMPTAAAATATLMDLTDKLKTENCVFQQDVIDAMFRQVYSDETVPYEQTHPIPGLIYATDFDMGVIGEAYYDNQAATYQVSTGNYTPWNSGWAYRNDGVDIERCADTVNANGYNVGFLDPGEWMQYEVEVAQSGVYEIHVRVASGGSGGRMRFESNGNAITRPSFAPPTGGWQNWQTLVIPNVILDTNDDKIRFKVDAAGFNLGSFEFIPTALATTDVPTQFMAASTLSEYAVQMNANKLFDGPIPTTPEGFDILVDGSSIPITSMALDANDPQRIIFEVDYILKSTEDIRISYTGTALTATDGITLDDFTLEKVENTLRFVHQIPGRIEAEAFDFQVGTELEESTDTGGGQNLSFLDPGDYLDYEVNVTAAGAYRVAYRTASLFGTGGIEFQLIDGTGNATVFPTSTFAVTGGWQNWETTTSEAVTLPVGRYTLRLLITAAPFNLNWVEFLSGTTNLEPVKGELETFALYPNPTLGSFQLRLRMAERQDLRVEVFNYAGQRISAQALSHAREIEMQLSLADQPAGLYQVVVRLADGSTYAKKLVKLRQ